MNQKKVTLNRAIFTARPLESSTLTVLSTLIHRFQEPGDYEVFVRRGDQLIHRAPVRVVKSDATYQINVDMSALDEAGGGDCCCDDDTEYVLNAGGVMTFHASRGTGAYNVSVTQIGEREKRTLLDSRKVIPAGDWFAVTLVRPGLYKVSAGDASGEVRVSLPKAGSGYSSGQANLVEVGQGGFRSRTPNVLAGQSLVFQMNVPGHVRVELVEPDKSTVTGETRGKLTVQNPRASVKSAGPQTSPPSAPRPKRAPGGPQKRTK
ncbi:MAG: hypothetical protein IT320_07840 [Anaerolineae bacterium]|nr:hypothetical protein [Anaerolineae bacterium]